MIFFWDSLKASKDELKRGIFSTYPVEQNVPLNFVQEMIAAVAILALTLNSTGFSMNAMRVLHRRRSGGAGCFLDQVDMGKKKFIIFL